MKITNSIISNFPDNRQDLKNRGLQLKILDNPENLYSLFGGRRRFVSALIDIFRDTEYSEYYKDYKTTAAAFDVELRAPGLLILALCDISSGKPKSMMIVNDLNTDNFRFPALIYNLLLFAGGREKYIEINTDLILGLKSKFAEKINLTISSFIKKYKIDSEYSDICAARLNEYCKSLTAATGVFFLYNFFGSYYPSEYLSGKLNICRVAELLELELRNCGYTAREINAALKQIREINNAVHLKKNATAVPVYSIKNLIKKTLAKSFLLRLLTNRRILYLSWLLSFDRRGKGIGMLNHSYGMKILSGIKDYNYFFGTSLNRRFFSEYCSDKFGGCGFYWVGPILNKKYRGAGFANSFGQKN